MTNFKLNPLPPTTKIETICVLKQLAISHKALAELNGYAKIIPNKNILINAVTINEAKDSSEIENIVTTHDELYRAIVQKSYKNVEAKEVSNYRAALWSGYKFIEKNGILTVNSIIEIQKTIENNDDGMRKLPGTTLINEFTGEVVYTPPSSGTEIIELMDNLVSYINEDQDSIDKLIKLAVIHYQFESIHPFYDGNGRTGRIINILYLVLKELLDSPILYLSKYIIKNKSLYYKLLQEVRTKNNWEEWILYILKGIEETSIDTLLIVKKINEEFTEYSDDVKKTLPKIYSKELIELLFFEFYTKITYIEKGLMISRKTASTYLNKLEDNGFLISERIGKERIFLNQRLLSVVKTAALRSK